MRSSLNTLFHINVVPTPSCSCGHPFEHSIHYIMEDNLYNEHRNSMPARLDGFNVRIELLFDESLS